MKALPRRFWLLLPLLFCYTVDILLTLQGQCPEYWAGEYSAVVEANPLAYLILLGGPWLFLGMALAWAIIQTAIVLFWRHTLSHWFAIGLTFAHALGASSWLSRLEPWGWGYVVVYLVLVSEASRWCWRRVAAFDRAGSKSRE